ncbi:MAG: helix-turn-helix domain-containing protein [Flavobacteriaceae bacterium]
MQDKRDLADIFRQRLDELIGRSGGNRSDFARRVGIDRSALTQMLAGQAVRMPRAETLARIASQYNVTTDWLLGLAQHSSLTEMAPGVAIAEALPGADITRLAEWHREAVGYKIRYVPTTIPDLLRTPETIAYEHARIAEVSEETQLRDAEVRLDYNRRPETEMEVCMPFQTVEMLARGNGIWSGLGIDERRGQIERMAELTEELYPTFRLFFIDGRRTFSAPYTVFGPQRVAVYLGGMYAVMTRTDDIRTFIAHFDGLIRQATINPNESARWLAGIAERIA